MRAVDAIMECLKAEGVEHVFGIPGGANLPTYDALYDAGQHEQAMKLLDESLRVHPRDARLPLLYLATRQRRLCGR